MILYWLFVIAGFLLLLLFIHQEPIEIGMGSYTGLRVSKRAIHDDYVTRTTYDDNDKPHKEQKKVQGVYVLYGSEVQFKQIDIIYATKGSSTRARTACSKRSPRRCARM